MLTGDEETQRALKLWVVLAKCFSTVAERDRKSIARFGLIPSEFGILENLYFKGPMLLSEVGRRLLLTSGSVTYAMDKLEKLGLVQRVSCPKDRRKIYAHLTDAGKEKIEAVFPSHAQAIEEAVSGLNPEEQQEAISLIKKLGLYAAKL